MHALVERAEQLAREQDSRAQLAALAERSRIAREMHDIVAHSLSVMVALADGAAATADRDPDRTRDALNQLADTGRSALGDMRALLSVLREDEGVTEGLQPAPGSRDLSVLIDRFRAAGLPIRYSVTGIPPAHPARELTIYRIIQEALTNVLRYADSPSTVEVAIEYASTETLLTVSDNGRRGPSNRPSEGAGRGIIGMGERAALHGGQASSGPLPDGGWVVRAALPVAGEEP
jgi:signal transduction histidine kinase